jgi:hypothetical protein
MYINVLLVKNSITTLSPNRVNEDVIDKDNDTVVNQLVEDTIDQIHESRWDIG